MYLFKPPSVEPELHDLILFPSMEKEFPCSPHVNLSFPNPHLFLVPLCGQQLSNALNSFDPIFKTNSSLAVRFIKSPGLFNPLNVALERSNVIMLPLTEIPLDVLPLDVLPLDVLPLDALPELLLIIVDVL